jgi:hypothetical protein
LSAIKPSEVAAVFDSDPPRYRRKLLLKTTKATDGVGKLEETLKWGEPAYLTAGSKSGTTIRIAWKARKPDAYAMFFHCQTNLVSTKCHAENEVPT